MAPAHKVTALPPLATVRAIRSLDMPDRASDDDRAVFDCAAPVVKKRKNESRVGAEKVKRPCAHCDKTISCPILPSGKIDEGALRAHEKKCTKKTDYVTFSVRGLKVGAVFGALGSGAEFQAPESVLKFGQGSNNPMDGAIHAFSDGSSHPVIGKKTGKILTANSFFKGVRCCAPENESIMQFRLRPEMFPKMYNKDGLCVIAEFGTGQVEGAPAPWSTSVMRLKALCCQDDITVFCIGCKTTIQICNARCASGQGPCRNCAGTRPNIVVYKRSLQAHFDTKELRWTTLPDASTILANTHHKVQFTCTVCTASWSRSPKDQVQQNSGCPGCDVRHRAELSAYELYGFVLPESKMLDRGQARLDGVHANPFDVASENAKIIVEIMSLGYHVNTGKLPNDTEKMLAALRGGYVYIMAHVEDYYVGVDRELAWKRCIVAALRMAKDNTTPRMTHVRRDTTWDAYNTMRDAALAAGFPYQDIFCGDVNAYATERLPGDTHTQKTLD